MARPDQVTRRALAFGIVGLPGKGASAITGSFVNESVDDGHRLRDRAPFASPRRTIRVPVLIVGAGVAGLSAGWRLEKRGFKDFLILEMEAEAGGNSRCGQNDVSPYPWAAHYVPVPGPGAQLVRELFEELRLLHDGHWDERHLCHSPQERLFLHGRWQEGLEPPVEPRQLERFESLIAAARATGRFTVPMEPGWRRSGPGERALDRLSMREWLSAHGLHSPGLLWYADYACRDDYGTSSAATSAWAGIHYFASRDPDEKGPLTWPEGNGWIVRRLLEKLKPFLRRDSMALRIVKQNRIWQVFTPEVRYDAQFVIFAAPTFLAPWLIEPAPPRYPLDSSPWLTANLTLSHWPAETDSQPAWDNVIYDSKSLGYVVATHQNLNTSEPRSVWTWYHAFSEGNPRDQRRVLLGGDWQYWKEFILRDLERAHPDIRRAVSHIDIMRLGHAMPRPAPGSMFLSIPTVHEQTLFFANSDLSRLSLFEEAQYRGVEAALHVLRLLSRG